MQGYAKLQFLSKEMKPNLENFGGKPKLLLMRLVQSLPNQEQLLLAGLEVTVELTPKMQRMLKFIIKETYSYYPFIDHCLKEFSERFPESSLSRFTGCNLHPDKVLQIKQAEIKACPESRVLPGT